MSIQVDQEKCIGCGACVATCPVSFKMNAEGKSEPASQESAGCTQPAAQGCPVQAITVS